MACFVFHGYAGELECWLCRLCERLVCPWKTDGFVSQDHWGIAMMSVMAAWEAFISVKI